MLSLDVALNVSARAFAASRNLIRWHNSAVANDCRSYALRTDIGVPVARVWAAWTNPTSLTRWCAPSAAIRAQTDGSFRVRFDSAVEIDAHVDVFEPRQRLRLILLSGSSAPAFDGVEIDDFVFEAYAATSGEQSRLRLLNSGLPNSPGWDHYYARKRVHWQRALARLKVFLEKNLDREESAL